MAETSYMWDGLSLGDAVIAPYSAAEFAQTMRLMVDDNAVAPMQRAHITLTAFGLGALLVSGVATPVSIADGYAAVAGYVYVAGGINTLAIATPSVNPRIDRVVLRVNWAAQNVRLARLAGAEAAIPAPPALTQTIGTTYEVSLAQVYITTGGVITVRDERLGSLGLSQSVLFRDLAGRTMEEFFDNFTALATSTGWVSSLTGTGALSLNAGVPSANLLTSGATAAGIGQIFRGTVTGSFFTELNQAPVLFEARMTPANAAIDAAAIISMKLQDSAGTSYIEFGAIGSVSTTALVIRCAAGGAATSFVTSTAIDASGAFHTLGIYVPAAGGPAVAMYDGVAIGQVAGANLPAATTDMRPQFYAGNGATAAARATIIDSARLVRGTA